MYPMTQNKQKHPQTYQEQLGVEELLARETMPPYVARLEAAMAVLGYGEWGDQKRFAADIGISPVHFNKVCKGKGLSTTVAFAIRARFGGAISINFLWFGDAGHGSFELEERLREWERRTSRRIFA